MGMLCLNYPAGIYLAWPRSMHALQLLSSSITCTCAVQPSHKSMCNCIALHNLSTETAASCHLEKFCKKQSPTDAIYLALRMSRQMVPVPSSTFGCQHRVSNFTVGALKG